ncbi:hypothetical protein D3C72_2403610 [compost metagenome]
MPLLQHADQAAHQRLMTDQQHLLQAQLVQLGNDLLGIGVRGQPGDCLQRFIKP